MLITLMSLSIHLSTSSPYFPYTPESSIILLRSPQPHREDIPSLRHTHHATPIQHAYPQIQNRLITPHLENTTHLPPSPSPPFPRHQPQSIQNLNQHPQSKNHPPKLLLRVFPFIPKTDLTQKTPRYITNTAGSPAGFRLKTKGRLKT